MKGVKLRIETIDIHHVAMPLREPWRTAASDEVAIESVFVRLGGGDVFGWGETAPHSGPNYSDEWAGGVFHVLREKLAPLVLGQEVADTDALQALLLPIKGNSFAKAGLDIALHDLLARAAGVPLWRAVGGGGPDVVIGADIAVDRTMDGLLEKIQAAVDGGAPRVKLKFRPGWDLDMVRTVRAHFPRLRMHVDCNAGFSLADLGLFKALDAFDLAMIEQPLGHDDLLDHAALRQKIGTPICLDETINSVRRARQAIEIGACDIINLKPGRLGGITPLLHVRQMCEDAGVGNWIGSMLESAVGEGVNLALATLPNMVYPGDVFPTVRLYETDLADRPIAFDGPYRMVAPQAPGTGWVPDPDRLKAMSRQRARLTL